MAATSIIGIPWILILLLGGAPVMDWPSLPPLPEDPALARVAPETCLLYMSWAGVAPADPDSDNATEALLAEPEIRNLLATVESEVVRMFRKETRGGGDKALLVGEVPALARTLLTRPAALFVTAADTPGMPFHAVLVLNAGDAGESTLRSLERIEAMLLRHADGTATASAASVGGLRRLPLPPEAPPVLWGPHGEYLVVTLGQGVEQRVISALDGAGEAPAWLRKLRSDLPVERPAMVLYADTAAGLQLLAGRPGVQGPGPIEALGLKNIVSLASVTGLEGAGFVSKSLVTMRDNPTGMMALLDGEPLQPGDLAPIPADASFAAAWRMDPARAFDELVRFLATVDPSDRSDVMQGIGEVERELGVSVRNDVFAHLGDAGCVYSSPGDGGLLVSGMTLVLRARDATALRRTLDRLMSTVRAEMERQGGRRRVVLRDFMEAGTRVYFLNAIGEEMPVAPSWCVTKDALVIAAYPQMIKAYLGRAEQEGSLATVPEVASLWEDGAGPQSLSYVDLPSVFEVAYPLLHPFGNLIMAQLQKEGLAVDISLLPSARSILPHLAPAVRSVVRTDDGILVTNRASVPVGGSSLGSLAPLFIGLRSHRAARHNAVRRAQTMEHTHVTIASLQQIGAALKLHELEREGLPSSLDELVTHGYLTEVAPDAWGGAFIYLPVAGGEPGPGTPVVAASRPTDDGKRVVLYYDGHVETLPEALFQQQRTASTQ